MDARYCRCGKPMAQRRVGLVDLIARLRWYRFKVTEAWTCRFCGRDMRVLVPR